MATPLYLAMTAAEYYAAPSLPPQISWMACHFSPYSLGLSNLPEGLPAGSTLMLSDIIPIHGHDPSLIARQLEECLTENECNGLLLDFQRFPCRETEVLADTLIQTLPAPVVLSEQFASDRNCPVLLSPCPPHIPLQEHLAPWKGRAIWMETSFCPTQLVLTPSGTKVSSLSNIPSEGSIFSDEPLHCHYCIQVTGNSAVFQLWRTSKDLEALMTEGGSLGVHGFVGLYQELIPFRNA